MVDKATRNRQNAKSRNKYNNATYASVTFRVRKDGTDGFTAEDLRRAAERDGMSLNAWIVGLIRDNI